MISFEKQKQKKMELTELSRKIDALTNKMALNKANFISYTNPSDTVISEFWKRQSNLIAEKDFLLEDLSAKLQMTQGITSMEKRDINLKKL